MLNSETHGYIAKRYCGICLPLVVLQSRAGFYIGTAENGEPVSRESVEYWQNFDDANEALLSNSWTQFVINS